MKRELAFELEIDKVTSFISALDSDWRLAFASAKNRYTRGGMILFHWPSIEIDNLLKVVRIATNLKIEHYGFFFEEGSSRWSSFGNPHCDKFKLHIKSSLEFEKDDDLVKVEVHKQYADGHEDVEVLWRHV